MMISTFAYNEAQEALMKLKVHEDDINIMEIKAKEMELDLKHLRNEIKSNQKYIDSLGIQRKTNESIVYLYGIQKRSELESFKKLTYAKQCLEYLTKFRCHMDSPDDRLPLTKCCWNDHMGENCNSLIEFFNKNGLKDIETIIGYGFSADDIIGVAHIQVVAPFRKLRIILTHTDGDKQRFTDNHAIFLVNSRFFDNEYKFSIETTIEMVPNDVV